MTTNYTINPNFFITDYFTSVMLKLRLALLDCELEVVSKYIIETY